jgi:predicted dehydrogenase
MTDKLRVGIAGYGVVGKRRREFIDRHPRLKTVAVSDRAFGADGTLADGVRHHADFRRMADEKLDALFVCLPNDIAPEATILGLEAGFHVFCEKPPARDLADMARVIACEKRHSDRTLRYGFNHRYHDSVREALAIVRSGGMGPVLNMRGVYGKSKFVSFGAHSDWRVKRAIAGGGILLDQGIHMVDLMRLFAGEEFADVQSFVSNAYWHHDVEDNAYALMRTASGVVAMLHSSATQWRHRFHLDIACARGSLTLAGILSGSKSYGAETLTVAWADPAEDWGDPREEVRRYETDNSWRDEIDEFAAAILDGAPMANGTSADALETLRLVYRIYCADPEWRERWDLSDAFEESRRP